MMNLLHKQCIQTNFQLLTDTLEASHVTDRLYQEHVLTAEEALELSNCSPGAGRRTRARKLLCTLQTRRDGYVTLKEALGQDGVYQHLVQALTDTENRLQRDIKEWHPTGHSQTWQSPLELGQDRTPGPGSYERNVTPSHGSPPSYSTVGYLNTYTHDNSYGTHEGQEESSVVREHNNECTRHISHHKSSREMNHASKDQTLDLSLRLSEVENTRPSMYGHCSCEHCTVQTYSKIPIESSTSESLTSDLSISTKPLIDETDCPSGSSGSLQTVHVQSPSSGPLQDKTTKLSVQCSDGLRSEEKSGVFQCVHQPDTMQREHNLNPYFGRSGITRPPNRYEFASVPHEEQKVTLESALTQGVPKKVISNSQTFVAQQKRNTWNRFPKTTSHKNVLLSQERRPRYMDEFLTNGHHLNTQESYDADSEDKRSDGDTSENDIDFTSCGRSNLKIEFPTVQSILTISRANGFVNKRAQRRLVRLFDDLSMMINNGDQENFASDRQLLLQHDPTNYDLRFILMYLTASGYLWLNEYTACEEVVKKALAVVPYTSQPSRALVEILSSRCWMLFQQKRYNRLQSVLREALETIQQDPSACMGKAAGWIYVDKARLNMAMMTGSDHRRILRLRKEGIKCLESALHHFRADNTRDGPFGYGFAGTMLASLLLMCGDRLHTVHIQPLEEDIQRARDVITEVEDSPEGIPGVLQVHVYLAKSDYHLRRGDHHSQRAMEQAVLARDLAQDLGMAELLEYAMARCDLHGRNIHLESYTASQWNGDLSARTSEELITVHRSKQDQRDGKMSSRFLHEVFIGLSLLVVLLSVYLLSFSDCISDFFRGNG